MKISDLYDLPMQQDNGCLLSNDCRYTIIFDTSDSNCDEQIQVVADALNSHDLLTDRIKELEVGLEKLINLASKCDSWESFPQQPLDDAYELIKQK